MRCIALVECSVAVYYYAQKCRLREAGLIETYRLYVCLFLCPDIQVEGSGLYPKIARINHSCAPNSIWTWVARDRSRRRKEVRACRPIRRGEEVKNKGVVYEV